MFLVAGGAGGSRIFPSVFQVILNVDADESNADEGSHPGAAILDLSSAVERSRLHNQLYPNIVDVDRPLEAGVVEALRTRGHIVECMAISRICVYLCRADHCSLQSCL